MKKYTAVFPCMRFHSYFYTLLSSTSDNNDLTLIDRLSRLWHISVYIYFIFRYHQCSIKIIQIQFCLHDNFDNSGQNTITVKINININKYYLLQNAIFRCISCKFRSHKFMKPVLFCPALVNELVIAAIVVDYSSVVCLWDLWTRASYSYSVYRKPWHSLTGTSIIGLQ